MAVPVPRKSVRVGVMMENIQLADIIGIDILFNLSAPTPEMEKEMVASGIPPEFITKYADHMIDTEFFYMATTLDPAPTTPTLRWLPNVTYDDCPRDLDIVITGGPFPSHRPAAADRFMKEAFPKTRVWLTTCTGSMWLASSGALNGKKATTNRIFLPGAKKLYPEVEWVEQRWVVQDKVYEGEGKGEVWTAGGAGAGVDMVADYCLKNFDPEFVTNVSLTSIDFAPNTPRGQFY
ncbi:hypothetical protein ACHAQA_007265 [Verticillium albo-atrum]